MTLFKKLVPLAVTAAMAGISENAAASGFQLIEQNASGLGNAYAGQAAAAENASTIFYNPAGMTLLPGKQVSGALHAIGPSVKFTDNGGSRSPAGAPEPGGGTNGGDAGGWVPTGNAYLSWQLSPQLWAGLGLSVPFGLKTEYDGSFIGRFQSRKAELQTYDINPSVAYKISDAVSIGGGLSYQHAKLTLDRSFFAGAELPESLKLSDSAWGWNLGAMFNLGPQTRIGLSYRSAVEYDLTGSVGITGVGAAGALLKAKLPDTLSWAVSHVLNDKWQLLGDWTYTRWSHIKNLPLVLTSAGLGATPAGTAADTLDLQFRNTYRIGIGANYKWNQDFTWKFGAAYDRTPVPDILHRTVFLPDNNRWWLALGGKYQVSKAGVIDFGYAHVFIRNGDTLRDKNVPPAGPSAGDQGIVSGNYKSYVNIVSIQYSHSF
jgi:long-chain fatty acid transport protein